MKYLTLIFLFFTSCAHIPVLQKGSCYRESLSVDDNLIQFLASYKIVDIQTLKGSSYYVVQSLDLWGDPITPGDRYPKVSSELFDKYFTPMSYKFTFLEPDKHIVRCNNITQEDPIKDLPTITRRDK